MDVSTRDAETALVFWPAARARAVRFYGGEVVGERRVAQIQGSGGNDGVAEALGDCSSSAGWRTGWAGDHDTYGGSCGPDTVEHVGSQGDGDEEIFRVADAHYVAWFVLREPIGAGIHTGVFHSQLVLDRVNLTRRTPDNKKLCLLHRIIHL